MITAAICMLTLGSAYPENPSFDYSGVPSLPGLTLKTHGIQIDMSAAKVATAMSTSVFKNESSSPVTATLTIPRRRVGDSKSGNPTFAIDAKWDNAPLKLVAPGIAAPGTSLKGDTFSYQSDLTAKVTFKPGQTCSLKLSYSLPFGRCGYEQKQKVTGYLFESANAIGLLSLSYRYGGPTVFHLPEAFPNNWGWQVGAKGVFVRKENFQSNGDLTYITFYPGGFDNIGGTGKGGGN